MQIRLFYCPFAFIIDAKIQYVVANFVQNFMWCLQRKKNNGTVKLKVLSTAPLTFLTFFALFLFSQTDSDCICTFLPTDCLHLRNVSYFAKAYRKLHCLQTVATLQVFFGNATAALAKQTKIWFAIYIKSILANCRNIRSFYASCAFCKKKAGISLS